MFYGHGGSKISVPEAKTTLKRYMEPTNLFKNEQTYTNSRIKSILHVFFDRFENLKTSNHIFLKLINFYLLVQYYNYFANYVMNWNKLMPC